MKQKFALEKTTFAVLMGLLAVLLLVPSCTTDDKVPDLSDEGTNDWIYKVMTDYYCKIRRRMAHFFPDREKGRGDEICFGVRFVWF